jgi:hypothetical protein
MIFLLLSTNFSLASSETVEKTAQYAGAKVYYPDKINVFEPFKARIIFTNKDLIKNTEEFLLTDCSIPFAVAMGLKSSELETSGKRYKYNKEEEIEIWLSAISDGKLKMIGINGEFKPRECDIWFKGNITNQNYLGLSYEFYPYSFGIKDLPSDFNLKEEEERDLWKRYERKGSDEISLFFNVKGFTKENEFYTFEELKTDTPPGYSLDQNAYTKEQLTLNGKPAVFWHSCKVHESYQETYTGDCNLYASIMMPIGPVWFEMKAKQLNPYESESGMLGAIQDWKSLFLNAVSNVYFESQGKNSDFIIEDSDNDYCGDCKQGYVCGACGNCIKEIKAVNPSEVELETDFEIKNDNKKMLNSIESNLALTIYPNANILHEGEQIDYCDLKFPGLKMKLDAQLKSNESFSGFTSGFPTDKREQEAICEIDFTQSQPNCVFIVSPSDRKKFFADAKEITQEYEFSTYVNGKNERIAAKTTLLPPKNFELSLNSKNNQVQQGSNTVLKITPKGGTTEAVILKTTLIGPGRIGLSSDDINANWILESVTQEDTLQIAYLAPALGNFDIGEELASLSMVDLQTQAAKQIALDAVTIYGGEYVGDIEELVDVGEYSSKIGHLTDAFKATNGARNLVGTDKAIKDMTGEFGDSMGVNDGKGDATWTERAADVGIFGISAAQTAVGVLTFIPNKIPGVDKLSSGVQTAFSAATNIWKANLQYISKSEKIERAQELYYPVVIVVTAQDISGWTTQEMHVFQIAYHQIK